MAGVLRTLIAVGFCLQLLVIRVRSVPPDWFPVEMLDLIVDDKRKCMEKYGTTNAMIDDVANGKLTQDESITCYMYCMFESVGLVDEEGVLDADMAISIMPDKMQDGAMKVFEVCNPSPSTDVCGNMYKLSTCVYAKHPEYWFFV